MNRKQLLIILVVAVVLGGIGLYLNRQKSASFASKPKSSGEKLLGDFPVNDVALIRLRDDTNEVNVVKANGWAVKERNSYPANSEKIIEFARKLWDLRPAQSQKIGESQLGRMQLLSPEKGGTNSATLVELQGTDGKTIRSLLLGKESMRSGGGGDPFGGGGGGWPNGRWIYLPDKPGTTYLVSETFNEVEPKPEVWLNKDFFKVEKARSIAVSFSEPTNSWKLTRETESGEWKLADARPDEKLDSGKASSVSYAFSSPTFEDVALGDQNQATNPVSIEIETFDGFGYTLKVGDEADGNRPLTVGITAKLSAERKPAEGEKPEDKEKLDKEFKETQTKLEEKLNKERALSRWTYRVSSWTVESVMKHRSELLAAKTDEVKEQESDAGETETNSVPNLEGGITPNDEPASDSTGN
jgi:hypothetical protein